MADINNEASVQQETKTEQTNEELLKALEEKDKEIAKLKGRVSEVNSEAANRKRATEEERNAKLGLENRVKELEQELESRKKAEQKLTLKNKALASGFNEELAEKTAEALQSGDFDTMFANIGALSESIKQNAVVGAMNSQKGLSEGDSLAGKTKPLDGMEERMMKAAGLI